MCSGRSVPAPDQPLQRHPVPAEGLGVHDAPRRPARPRRRRRCRRRARRRAPRRPGRSPRRCRPARARPPVRARCGPGRAGTRRWPAGSSRGRTAPPGPGSRRRPRRPRSATRGATRSSMLGRPPSDSTAPASATSPSSIRSADHVADRRLAQPGAAHQVLPGERAVEEELGQQGGPVAQPHARGWWHAPAPLVTSFPSAVRGDCNRLVLDDPPASNFNDDIN